jgi:hypothetical protein
MGGKMNKETKSIAFRFSVAAVVLCSALMILNLAAPAAVAANDPTAQGTVTIEGTATIYGEWSCKGDADVKVTPGDALPAVPGFPGGVQATLVTVTVKNIDCGDGTMNKHMRKALKEKDFPTIQFKTDKYVLNDSGDVVKALGKLTIAGFTNNVELDASLANSNESHGFRAEGKVDIQMEDYKVKPPSLLFGTLKVANDVSIKYSANITPSGKTEQASASLETK